MSVDLLDDILTGRRRVAISHRAHDGDLVPLATGTVRGGGRGLLLVEDDDGALHHVRTWPHLVIEEVA